MFIIVESFSFCIWNLLNIRNYFSKIFGIWQKIFAIKVAHYTLNYFLKSAKNNLIMLDIITDKKYL